MSNENTLIKMYSRTNCPMDPPVRQMLKSANIPYEYIDIRHDETANALVRQINRGNESVPTLVFPDGSTLTEPSTAVLRQKLESLGYKVPKPNLWQSLRDNPFYSIMGTAMFLFGLYDGNWVFMVLGLGLLVFAVVSSRR